LSVKTKPILLLAGFRLKLTGIKWAAGSGEGIEVETVPGGLTMREGRDASLLRSWEAMAPIYPRISRDYSCFEKWRLFI